MAGSVRRALRVSLPDNQGTGVSGLILVSPALDLGGRSMAFDPFSLCDTAAVA